MNQKEDAAFHAQNNLAWVKTAHQSKIVTVATSARYCIITKFRSQNVEISEVNIFYKIK